MGSAASVAKVVVSSELPKHGVRLKFIDEFITSCGGVDVLRGLTTEDDAQKSVNGMLATINVGKSRAYNPTDEKQIKEAVQKTVGFAALNKIVFEQLRAWMVDTTKCRLDACPDDLSLMTALGELYKVQGRFEDAEPLLTK
eukprot:gene27164-35681_t